MLPAARGPRRKGPGQRPFPPGELVREGPGVEDPEGTQASETHRRQFPGTATAPRLPFTPFRSDRYSVWLASVSGLEPPVDTLVGAAVRPAPSPRLAPARSASTWQSEWKTPPAIPMSDLGPPRRPRGELRPGARCPAPSRPGPPAALRPPLLPPLPAPLPLAPGSGAPRFLSVSASPPMCLRLGPLTPLSAPALHAPCALPRTRFSPSTPGRLPFSHCTSDCVLLPLGSRPRPSRRPSETFRTSLHLFYDLLR